ncbi:haloacid dehalogenase [Spirochaetia bacterium]|nr:haloacid dehalogenase [Spirochaetia bacterium]
MQHKPSIDPAAVTALALDLDGTLLAPGALLTGRSIRALRACLDRGIGVIICTGRAVETAERYRQRIGVEGPMVCYNGAEVLNTPGGEILGAAFLDRTVVDYCIDLSRQMGVYYQVYFPKTQDTPREVLMAETDGPEAEMYRNHTGIRIEFGDLKQALAAPGLNGVIKSMFLTDEAVMEKIRPLLWERFGDRVCIVQTMPTFLEVMRAGVSKGTGLRIALDHAGLSPDGVIAFGDEENDLPLFEVAGRSLAPANARERVKAAADLIIGPCAEDGVAAFLEENILKIY